MICCIMILACYSTLQKYFQIVLNVLKLTNGRAGAVHEYHYEPHLQLE